MSGGRTTVSAAARRAFRLLGLTALVAALACTGPGGDGRDPEPSLDAMYGRVFIDSPLLLLPAGGWDGAPRKQTWKLRSPATLFIEATFQATEALVIELLAADPAPKPDWACFWDDGDPRGITLTVDGALLRVTVPPRRLTPGPHRLTLALPGWRPRDRAPEFSRFAWRCGGEAGEFRPDDRRELRRIAGLPDNGVLDTGEDGVHRGGFLFLGPHARQCRVDGPAPSRLELSAVNRSAGEARFTVSEGRRSASAAVAPGETAALSLELPAGERLVTFAVKGPEGGAFWWDAPVLRPGPAADLPPVILITLDTTRRDAVSPWSGDGEATPVLAAFAAEATAFNRAHAVAPWTLPSHASIFTGRYPSEHGAGVRRPGLPPDSTTLAARLRARGYHTAGFAGGALSSARYGVARGFVHYRDPEGFQTPAHRLTNKAIAHLEAAGDRPLFLFVNYFDPHFPYKAPKRWRERFMPPGYEGLLTGLDHWPAVLKGDTDAFRQLQRAGTTASTEALEVLRAAYRSEVAHMDHQLGRLLDELRRRGLYRRAFIAILADHGEFLGEQGFYDHSYRLDAELIEIPMLVKWPDQDEPRSVDLPVSQVDLFPTVLRLTGAGEAPSSGLPLQPEAREALAARPRLLMEEHSLPVVHFLGPDSIKLADHLFGLVEGDARTWAWDGGQQCFRREGEAWLGRPCVMDWPETLEAVSGHFAAAGTLDAPVRALDNEEREHLRQLGYVE